MSRWKLCNFLVGAILVGGGCAEYQAEPITAQRVATTLASPTNDELVVEVSRIKHPLLKGMSIDLAKGLTPRQAAVVAVILNPSLRAMRNQRNAADAQLLQAGILPNPQFTFDFAHPIPGGVTDMTSDGSVYGVNWDVQELITRDARITAAKANSQSVDLEVAWQEWQIAEAAEQAATDLLSLQQQRQAAEGVDSHLSENLSVVRGAVDQHQKTIVELAAAETTSRDEHALLLQAQRDEDHARIMLNRALGFGPDTIVKIRPEDDGSTLGESLKTPSSTELIAGLEDRRLDLLALRKGYDSQEETLRAAVLGQFPKINIGFNHSIDTTNVHSIGFGVTMDIPIFDRNQGSIAAEKATRQRLFDEYAQRVFEARSDIAMAVADIRAISAQIADAQQALPALKRLVDTYRDAMQGGNADVLSYYGAQVDLAQKTIDVLKLRQQLADTRIALQIAAGQFITGATAGATTQQATTKVKP